MNRFLKIIGWLFAICLLAALALIYFSYQVVTPLKTNKFLDLEIKNGMTGNQVADILAKEKLIAGPLSFKLMLRFTGKGREIKSGFYRFSSNQSAFNILEKMVKGETEQKMVTFPEGKTLKEMGPILQKTGLMKSEDFIRVAQNYRFKMGDWEFQSPEGFLLPETYLVPIGITPERMVTDMLGQFQKEILPEYLKMKDKLPLPLSLKEVVVLASLVEREAQVSKERPVIAAVYYNRLIKGMKLECDATIQYVLGWKPLLTFDDLKIDSPYNTYRYEGLPPGPIANPGKAALLATLHPKKNDFLFYVLNYKKNDGSHLFSRNYDEHLRKIRSFDK